MTCERCESLKVRNGGAAASLVQSNIMDEISPTITAVIDEPAK